MSIHPRSREGVTLVELVIVLALLAMLTAIVVPNVIGFIQRAQLIVDQSTIRILNTATAIYGMDKSSSHGDIFEGFDTDEQRMEELVDNGFLSAVTEPKRSNTEFIWNIENQEWLYSVFAISDDPLTRYTFSNMSMSDFTFNSWGGGGGSTWSINKDGLFVTGTNNNDLLFIDNNNSEYTLTAHFKLNENSGQNGGFGIFFETVLNKDDKSRDTGYILQFDRGFSEIVIRKRVNGTESNSSDMLLARIGNRSTSTVKNKTIPYKTDSTWWESKKEMSVSVKESGTLGVKLITVSLDGEVLLSNLEIKSDTQASNNYTGFRAWNSAAATVYDLTIE